jgi:hypothetical protein
VSLTRTDLERELGHITYKPGFRFGLFEHPYEGTWLRIDAIVPNSTKDGTIDLRIDVPIPPLTTVADLHRWLKWRLTRHEIHEACEWFKVDGVAPYDPHEVAL